MTSDRDVALAFYRASGGDVKKAAAKAGVTPATLKRWVTEEQQGKGDEIAERKRVVIEAAVSARPRPPADLIAPLNFAQDFRPSPELESWVIENILSPLGPLYNHEHQHLNNACLGFVFTNAPMRRGGKDVAGLCEMPKVEGDWAKARQGFLLNQWFGRIPDFNITLYAPFAGRCSDAEFCALVEHELYHCGHSKDQYGSPRYNKFTGMPVFTMNGHDLEQFKGVRRRYGATSDAEREYESAMMDSPTVSQERISIACGTCIRV